MATFEKDLCASPQMIHITLLNYPSLLGRILVLCPKAAPTNVRLVTHTIDHLDTILKSLAGTWKYPTSIIYTNSCRCNHASTWSPPCDQIDTIGQTIVCVVVWSLANHCQTYKGWPLLWHTLPALWILNEDLLQHNSFLGPCHHGIHRCRHAQLLR